MNTMNLGHSCYINIPYMEHVGLGVGGSLCRLVYTQKKNNSYWFVDVMSSEHLGPQHVSNDLTC